MRLCLAVRVLPHQYQELLRVTVISNCANCVYESCIGTKYTGKIGYQGDYPRGLPGISSGAVAARYQACHGVYAEGLENLKPGLMLQRG